jgi:glycosyltransferase involved in cell wall biosynthesis
MNGPSGTAAPPKVTVIIPTYNWSTVLPYSIGSVLRQNFADFELLVIGDGCTDDSEKVVTAITDPRLRWINLPVNNGHQSAPNNEGLRQARGSIIAYLGHDDLWLPHHLEVLVAAIDAGADIAHSIVQMIGAEGNIMPGWEIQGLQPGDWMAPTGVAHRRTAAEKVGGWRDYRTLYVDPETDLWLRMHHAGFALQHVSRLTAVKFPAGWRKDSYKKKLNHEQQQWTERILDEKDLEAVEMGRLLLAEGLQRRANVGSSASLRAALSQTGAKILRRLRVENALQRVLRKPKGAPVRQKRQFKGL